MGFLDTILQSLPQEHAREGESGLGGAIMQMIEGQNGGIAGLVRRFQSAGLGQQINSWVNTGPNQPVAPQDVHRALGDQQVNQLADRTGMEKGELLPLLAQFLPTVIDRLTPNGRVAAYV